MSKVIWNAAILALAALTVLTAMLGIWTGDDRWLSTMFVLLCTTAIVGVFKGAGALVK